MECRTIKKLLPAMVDSQLAPDEQRHVDEHVQSCATCRAELADLRAMLAHLHNVEQIEPPPWMTQKVMARIRAEAQPSKGFWERMFGAWPMKIPLGAVATVMLAAFVVIIFRSIQPELVRDAVQDAAKQTASVPESTPPKEPLSSVSRREGTQKERRVTAEKAVPEKPAMAPPRVQKTPVPPLPQATASAPEAELPAKARKYEDRRMEAAERYEKYDAAGGISPAETYKAKKSAPPPASRSAVPDITVVVADVGAAAGQVRAAVLKSGGRVVSSELTAARQIITVEIPPDKITGLREQLRGIGLVTDRLQDAGATVSVSRIRIELVRAQ